MSATLSETRIETRDALPSQCVPQSVTQFATIGAYALQGTIGTEAALDRARTVLLGALADLFLALNQVEGRRTLRALLPGNVQPGGARVPGTSYELEPRAAATAIGTLVSADATESIPSPLRVGPLAAMLAVADFVGRKRAWRSATPLTIRELLSGLIRAEQVRRSLEQSTSLAMSQLHCLLGATTAAALSLMSRPAVQSSALTAESSKYSALSSEPPKSPALDAEASKIGVALQRVWLAAGSAPTLSLANLHAEAVQWALEVDGPSIEGFSVAAIGNPGTGEVFQPQPIAGCTSDECSAVVQRFEAAVQTRLPLKQCERIKAIVADTRVLDRMAVHAFVAELVANQA